MYNLVLNPKQVFWRWSPYKSGHYRPANGTPLKWLFLWRADGGPIGLLCASWMWYPNIHKWGNYVSRDGIHVTTAYGVFQYGGKAGEANFNMGVGYCKMYIHAHMHAHTHVRVHADKYPFMYARTCMHACICMHAFIYLHPDMKII